VALTESAAFRESAVVTESALFRESAVVTGSGHVGEGPGV
jgi:hypothetical protein